MGRHKQAVGLRGRKERQNERRRLGKLRNNMVGVSTLERYRKAVVKFLCWIICGSLLMPRRMWDLDPVLSDYVEHLWEEGDGISFANDTLAGLLHYRPRLKDYLPMSRKLIKTWNKKELPARAPPPLTLGW